MAVEFKRCGSLILDAMHELDLEDRHSILDVLGEPVLLEDGITLQEMLRCLKPWNEAIKRITGTDVAPILARMEVKYEGAKPPREEITEVTLRPVAHTFEGQAQSQSVLEIVWNAEARYKNPVGFGILAEETTYLTCVPAWFLRDAKIRLIEDCASAGTLRGLVGPAINNSDFSADQKQFRLIPRMSDCVLFGLLCNLI